MSKLDSKTSISDGLDSRVLVRTLEEGYGPGAWHGPNLKAATDSVPPTLAFWRPSPDRHSIAEIVLHHAYCARDVRGRLSGTAPEPFVLEGEDWFAVPDASHLAWTRIRETLDAEQQQLTNALAASSSTQGGRRLSDNERFDLVLGITCHAVYHAGQIQLIKKLAEQAGASTE